MINHWMFRCKDVSEKVSLAMEAQVPWHQRLGIRFHLMMCRYCARVRRQFLMLRTLSRRTDSPPPGDTPSATLSPETKERIKDKLRPFCR